MYEKQHGGSSKKLKIELPHVRVLLSHVQLFATPWTVSCQAPLSMELSKQEHWSGLPFPSPGDLPDPGIEPGSPALQADSLPSESPGKPRITIWSSNSTPGYKSR